MKKSAVKLLDSLPASIKKATDERGGLLSLSITDVRLLVRCVRRAEAARAILAAGDCAVDGEAAFLKLPAKSHEQAMSLLKFDDVELNEGE